MPPAVNKIQQDLHEQVRDFGLKISDG